MSHNGASIELSVWFNLIIICRDRPAAEGVAGWWKHLEFLAAADYPIKVKNL
jgi:hypothetical protein